MPSTPFRHALAALVVTLFLLASMRAFFSAVYFSNLTSLGITTSAAWALVLVAPALLLLPGLRKGDGHLAVALLGVVAALRVGTLLADGTGAYLPLAGLTVAGALLLLPALLVRAAGVSRGGATSVAVGMAAAVALDAGVLFAFGSVDPTLHRNGLWLVAPLAVVLAVLAVGEARAPRLEPVPRDASQREGALVPGVALGAWLFLQVAVVGNAHHVARWVGAEAAPMAFGIVVGVGVGSAVVTAPLSRVARRTATAALNGVAVAFVLDLAFLHSAALPALLLLTQAALVVNLVHVLDALGGTFALAAGGFAVAGGVALVALFVDVFAWTFAFVPLGDVWEGSAPVLLTVAMLLVVAGAGWASGWFRGGVRAPALSRPLVAFLVAVPVLLASVPLAMPAAPMPIGDDTDLRVMTFNVHQGFNNDGFLDPALFVDVLRDADADVVVLQESDTARLVAGNVDITGYLARELGYRAYHGPTASTQSFGVAILSRYAIVDAETLPLTSFSDNRFIAKARLDVGGTDVWVYAVHLGLPERDRTAQTAELLADAATVDGPVILAGDFNSCPGGLCPGYEGASDDVYADVTATYQDAWTAAGHADAPAGHTYDALAPFERIDYVFVSTHFAVTHAEVLATPKVRAASDHLPVVADVRLTPGLTPGA